MATEKFQYLNGTLIPGTKYRVIRLLGAGGMGTVYEVEDTTIDKRYVLKTLHATLSTRKDLVERMQREAKALARLEHRNIVQVITADVTGDSLKLPYFVMQKLNGHTLRTVLDHKGRLEIDAAVRLTIDLLNALYHAHEHGIVHRDVKPENIFLHRDSDGLTVPKLLDFGVMSTTEAVTMTGQRFIGTLRYAAPEQLMGEKVSAATDLYAASLVLYESLAGRGPFEDEGEAMKVARAHLEKAPPLLSTFREVPAALERLIMRSLAKKSIDRHPDAFTYAAELHRFLRELRGSIPPASASTAADVLQLEAPQSVGNAMRDIGVPRGDLSAARAMTLAGQPPPTRADIGLAGSTVAASMTEAARLAGTPPGQTPPAAQQNQPAPFAPPSAPMHHRGPTLNEPPVTMTLGEEPLALKAVLAREAAEAAQREAIAQGKPIVDRQAITRTMAGPLAMRDGKTEMIDSMIGEGLAFAGTPPARHVKHPSIPPLDNPSAPPPALTPEPSADGKNGSATSVAGNSARSISETTQPRANSKHGLGVAVGLVAVIAIGSAGVGGYMYATHIADRAATIAPAAASKTETATGIPSAVLSAALEPASPGSASPASAPTATDARSAAPSAAEAPAATAPNAASVAAAQTANSPAASPSASASAPVASSNAAPLATAKSRRGEAAKSPTSRSNATAPAAHGGSHSEQTTTAPQSSPTAAPPPASDPPVRKLPGSGL